MADDEFLTLDSLLIQSEIAEENAVQVPIPEPRAENVEEETVETFGETTEKIVSETQPYEIDDPEPLQEPSVLESREHVGTQLPYTAEISKAIRSAAANRSNVLLDCFSADSFSSLISSVLVALNLKPDPSSSQDAVLDARVLETRLTAQTAIIEELAARFQQVQALVKSQAQRISESDAVIKELTEELVNIPDRKSSRQTNDTNNFETGFSSQGSQSQYYQYGNSESRARTAAKSPYSPKEAEKFIRRISTGRSRTHPEFEELFHQPEFDEASQEYRQTHSEQRPVAALPSGFSAPQEEGMTIFLLYAAIVTKPMILEAARMLAAKKHFDPPTVLGIGLKSLGEKSLARQNPYQHLIKTPYQMEAHSYRTQSIVPGLARHAFNHQEHLSSVLERQTHELLSTTTPDQYIRVLHKQLQSMLETLHDCVDALAEEARSSERWKTRLEQFKKQVEREKVNQRMEQRNMETVYAGNIKRNQRLNLLNVDIFPTVLLNQTSNAHKLEKMTLPKKKKIAIKPLDDVFESTYDAIKSTRSHSRPKYVAPID